MRGMILAALLWLAPPAWAEVVVTEAWVRGTVAAQKSSAGYLKIRSTVDAKLVAASTSAAKSTEVHEMSMEGSVMRMREVPSLALPAGKTVELKPGGLHLMLMGLAKPLAKGEQIPIRLTVEDGAGRKSEVNVNAEVRMPSPDRGHGGH